MTDDRHFTMTGALNFRDVGGTMAANKTFVARGRIYRSGGLSNLSSGDLDTLAQLDIRSVVDFRIAAETEIDGTDHLPETVNMMSIPIGGNGLFNTYARSAGELLTMNFEKAFAEGTHERMEQLHREFVAVDAERQQFGKALATIIDHSQQPIVFHCTAGKDRTGWMAAIIQSILGVPWDTILSDYVSSTTYFAPVAARASMIMQAAGGDPRQLQPLFQARPEYLRSSFDEVNSIYGSFPAFISDGLRIDADAITMFRKHMLKTV